VSITNKLYLYVSMTCAVDPAYPTVTSLAQPSEPEALRLSPIPSCRIILPLPFALRARWADLPGHRLLSRLRYGESWRQIPRCNFHPPPLSHPPQDPNCPPHPASDRLLPPVRLAERRLECKQKSFPTLCQIGYVAQPAAVGVAFFTGARRARPVSPRVSRPVALPQTLRLSPTLATTFEEVCR
jgi:hypothetical protein